MNMKGLNPGENEKRDYPLMAAVEQGQIKGVSTGTRLVVVGDSMCLQNSVISTAANHDFAYFAVNWLLDRPKYLLSGLAPKPIREYRISLTRPDEYNMRWLFLAGFPGLILILGSFVWLRRRT
jgi:hypothetical protein